ncbi:MAG: hypothetical protein H5T50_05465 [Nitrososphaeria archaeon]|nr:hypothetical protein [Nitrososphaeria archaeon]
MSQEEVYKIIKELGGEATTQEIKERAKEKFPNYSLYLYVSNRLKKLEKWGIIKKTEKGTWKIIKNYK